MADKRTKLYLQPEQQDNARRLEPAVTSAVENGVAWFTYWESHDGNPKFRFHPEEYHLGLLTNDNRVKPQGQMFQALGVQAEGMSECEVAHGLVVSQFETNAAWLCSASFTTTATESALIPRRKQYADPNQFAKSLAPLLELHDLQHSEMFSLVMIVASLMMCSQLA